MGLESMGKTRLEAFSDGVFAILVTILVLELKTPHGSNWHALVPLIPKFCAYVLSFVFLGIYWTNHHHLLHASHHVTGTILWLNLHLLFWLSLIPFGTAWMGENAFQSLPVATYGVLMLMSGVAYKRLQDSLAAREGEQSHLAQAMRHDRKGKLSIAAYATAIPLAFYARWASLAIYVLVAISWFLPEPRIESRVRDT